MLRRRRLSARRQVSVSDKAEMQILYEVLKLRFENKTPVSFRNLPDEDVEQLIERFKEKGFFPGTDKTDYIRDDKSAIVLKNKDNIFVVFYAQEPHRYPKKEI